MSFSPLLPPPSGLERIGRGVFLPRHRHDEAFAAVVLSGGYRECGDEGRFDVGPGDVLVHLPFEAHEDCLGASGAIVLNLPCPAALLSAPRWRVIDADALAKLATRDSREGSAALEDQARPRPDALADWPDLLASRLRQLAPMRLREWAEAHGLAPETVSRGFGRTYGVTPHRYRAEARARQAIAAIRKTRSPLAAIAADLGFSDQAHMSRAVKAITGRSPMELRGTRHL